MKKNYIQNDELYQELLKTRQTGVPTEKLGQLIIDLHNNILQHKMFRNYKKEMKEDMCSYSYERIFKHGIYTFDLEKKDSAFSYFTRGIFVNFWNFLKRYYSKLNKHQNYVKRMLQMKTDQLVGNQTIKRYAESFQSSDEI